MSCDARGSLSVVEKLYLSAVMEAMDGFAEGPFTYRSLRFLAGGAQGIVLCAERHCVPDFGQPRVTSVTIKVPWLQSGHNVREECQRRTGLGALPHVGDMPYIMELPWERLAGGPAEEGGGPELAGCRLAVLVTPLRHERSTIPMPQPLFQVIPPHGPRVFREVENWLNLARDVATALWVMHERGWAHGDLTRSNIVVRLRYGHWRDTTLVDFGSVMERCHEPTARWGCVTPDYMRPERLLRGGEWVPALEDLYALGVCLVEIVLGAQGMQAIWQEAVPLAEAGPMELMPPDRVSLHYGRLLRERARAAPIFASDFGERALNLCARYLLGEPPAPPARDQSIRLLQDFLAAIEALRFSLRRVPRHRTPDLPIGENPLSWQLIDLCQTVHDKELRAWCRRYTQPGWPAELKKNAANCTRLLKDGRCRAAADGFYFLLRRGLLRKKDEILRALRLFAGVLEAREEDCRRADEVLAKYVRHRDPDVSWWAQMLAAKLDYHRGKPLERMPELQPAAGQELDHRQEAWRLSLRCLYLLHRNRRLGPAEISDLQRSMKVAASTHESAFGALVLARAYARDRNVIRWRKVMPTILMSANYAALRGLPHEYAAALIVAASVVLRAFQDRRFAEALYLDGADPDECLVDAAECALKAAEIYRWLGLPSRSRLAMERAASCLTLCGSPDHRAEALRWLSLARNNRYLVPGAIASSDDSQLTRAVEAWRSAARRPFTDSHDADPGSSRAADFYNRYGMAIELLWQTEGSIAVELPEGGSAQETAPGATFEWLLQAAGLDPVPPGHRLVELGCGVGAEAIRAARRGFEVVGVDNFPWCIDEARRRSELASGDRAEVLGRLSFECLDLAPMGELLRERFDVALSRESLCHVSQKRLALRALWRCLRPGGILLLTDLVQKRTSAIADWRTLFEMVWFTNLETVSGYRALLEAEGFEILTIRRAHHELRTFFQLRLKRLSEVSGSLRREAVDRARTILATLEHLSAPSGPLGWALFVARRPR